MGLEIELSLVDAEAEPALGMLDRGDLPELGELTLHNAPVHTWPVD
ncbi:hypothetical protein GCM10023220_28080 [Streptomyces ziwulingensis]|uniref:Uncharacterized protein n=1 Tax=Streptomyces ziwulingensis TaxID=1045501 RepID=A0ABP9BPJ3_9ACTN